MTTALSQLRLLQIADSAFPTGAFAFSNGLETLVEEGRVSDKASAKAFLLEQILPRWAAFDRVFLGQAHGLAGNMGALLVLDQRCHLQNTSPTLADASRRMGRAILSVHVRLGTVGAAEMRAALQDHAIGGCDPVVQGMIGAGLGLSADETAVGALHAMVAAYLSAAVRLGTLGAIEAQTLLSDAGPAMSDVLVSPIPDEASAPAILAEIASLRRDATRTALFAT
ncbi:MAG: urease accessory UreF family protein [Pseudomonadota bacterium]